jgi:hypothetical protein
MKTNMKHEIKVGDGMTIHGYSDAHAYTVIAVTACTIKLQRDKATLLNGANSGEADALKFSPGGFVGHTSGTQRYAYERDTNGEIVTARLAKKPARIWTKDAGEEYAPGQRAYGYVEKPAFTARGQTVTEGRHEHYDFNF